MASPEYTPLRVRAWLRSPVVADQWLPLDGVLLYQYTRFDMGSRDASFSGASHLEQPKGEAMRGGRIPVDYVHGKDWYYRCSWAQWGPYVDGQDAWSKRFDMTHAELIDFKGRRGRIDTSAATYKAYRMPVFYRAALWVEWYCVGDPRRVGELLYAVTHLGNKTSQGWGRVMRWEVEPWPDDWSVMRDGRLTRGVPVYHAPRGQAQVMGLYGVRPPYWDRRNQMDLVMPT